MLVYQAKPFYVPDTLELRFLPEGPRVLRNYTAANPTLGWVTIQTSATAVTGSVNLLDLVTLRNDVHPLPGRAGFFAETDRDGVVVVGMERTLVLYDLHRRRIVSDAFPVTGDPRVIINEGMAIPGGLLFGAKHLTFSERIACMYWFDAASRRLHTLHSSQICSNGKFLRDGRLVDIDSFNKTLDEYPIDLTRPELGTPRIVADFRDTPLFPDGLRPSPDGESVIVAFYNPEPAPYGVARQFRIADGAGLAEWRLPGSPRVTCPEFVRMDNVVRVIFTTAIEGMDPVVPLAGALFVADTPFSDLPEPPPLFPAASL